MSSRKSITATVLLLFAGSMLGAAPAQAEPLIPLTPGEIHYLDHLRRVLIATNDPMSFRSDGELLVFGRYACDKRATGFVGHSATFVPAALTQAAFIHLCPE